MVDATEYVKPAEYARRRGLNRSTISRQIKAGVIPIRSDGKINPAQADRARTANLSPIHSAEAALRKCEARPVAPVGLEFPAYTPVGPVAVIAQRVPVDPQKRAILGALQRIAAPGEQITFATIALRAGCTPLQAFIVARWFSIAPTMALEEITDEDLDGVDFVDPTITEWRRLLGAEFDVDAAENAHDRITGPDLRPAA